MKKVAHHKIDLFNAAGKAALYQYTQVRVPRARNLEELGSVFQTFLSEGRFGDEIPGSLTSFQWNGLVKHCSVKRAYLATEA